MISATRDCILALSLIVLAFTLPLALHSASVRSNARYCAYAVSQGNTMDARFYCTPAELPTYMRAR